MATIVHHFFGFREPEESVVPTVESQNVSGQLSALLHGANDNVGVPAGRALYSGRASPLPSGGVMVMAVFCLWLSMVSDFGVRIRSTGFSMNRSSQ